MVLSYAASVIKESKASRLSLRIQDWIDREQFDPGTRLGTKPDLMAEHNVSSGTLNEALRLLQSRGYVEVKTGPGGGVFVARMVDRVRLSTSLLSVQDEPSQLDSCFHVQDALQEAVCIEAALACGPAERVRIQEAVDRLTSTDEPGELLQRIWDLDKEIAQTGNSAVLSSVYSMIIDTIRASVQRWPRGGTVSSSTVAVHVRMAEAVMANDIDAARACAKEHSPIDYAATAKERLGAVSSRRD